MSGSPRPSVSRMPREAPGVSSIAPFLSSMRRCSSAALGELYRNAFEISIRVGGKPVFWMALRTKLRIFCCLRVSSSVIGTSVSVFIYSLCPLGKRGRRQPARAYNSRQAPFIHGATLRIRSHPNDPRAAPGEAAHRPGAKKGAGAVVGQKTRPRGAEAHTGIERQAAGLRLSKQGL